MNLKKTRHRKSLINLIAVTMILLVAAQAFGADPAPASAPVSSDPVPASPPVRIYAGKTTADPAPASPPSSNSDPAPASPPSSNSDPAPASPPSSNSDPAPANPPNSSSPPTQLSEDPEPAGAPGSSISLPEVPLSESMVPPSPIAPASRKAFLGVGFRDPSNTTVTTLWSNSTASKMGIELGDKILSINGFTVGNLQQIREALSSMAIGDAATVTVARGDEAAVSIGPMPLGAAPIMAN